MKEIEETKLEITDIDPETVTELSDDDFEKEFGDLAMDFTAGVVSTDDNVNIPALTIRAIFISTLFAIPLTAINTVASFRNNPYSIPSTIANILAYPIGVFFAASLPDVSVFGASLNPGPFSVKEHVLINTIVSAASATYYGIDNVIAQKLFFNDKNVNILNSLVFVALVQFLGYGLAGLGRRFFVKPTAMLWPSVLGQIAFFNSFHQTNIESPDSMYYNSMSRYTAFWLAFGFMFFYQWIPALFAPALASVSVLCFLTKNRTVRFLGSANYNQGPGVLSFSFDWTLIGGQYAPMYVNWNSMFGIIMGTWILSPLFYYMNVFHAPLLQSTLSYGGNQITSLQDWKNSSIAVDPLPPYASNSLFDANGYQLSMSIGDSYPNLLDANCNLNMTVYQQAGSKIYMSPAFSFGYIALFLSFGAMFSQTYLLYGKDIYRQCKEAYYQTETDLDSKDPHYKIMKNYKDISEGLYLVYFGILTVLCIIFCQISTFNLPWYGTILSILLSIVGIFPIGSITGITGVQPTLNILCETVGGLIFAGHTVEVMTFKSIGTNVMLQAVQLLADLKLGYYMHIDPRAMVAAQFLGTLYGAIINTATSFYAMDNIVSLTDLTTPYNANYYLTFVSAGGLWGALGPARSFGPSSPYWSINLAYIVGFLLPFIPWLMGKIYPAKLWNYINIYVIVSSMFPNTGSLNSGVINQILVQILVQYYLYKYKREFWDKYVFSIMIALDTAGPLVSAFVGILQAIVFQPGTSQKGLFAPLNNVNDYYCYGQTWDGKPTSF
ncbi:hypothetical protein HDV04_002199 [Boothiomyces sp. JEL0838]|nr:hypothetical protein HDV04_002198 [Boothiomyces sp. JEL0838]KAJ3313393.1 hypothetical protein HDV04_002199 [Boothiomyces sp. JEL0838]